MNETCTRFGADLSNYHVVMLVLAPFGDQAKFLTTQLLGGTPEFPRDKRIHCRVCLPSEHFEPVSPDSVLEYLRFLHKLRFVSNIEVTNQGQQGHCKHVHQHHFQNDPLGIQQALYCDFSISLYFRKNAPTNSLGNEFAVDFGLQILR